MSYGSNVLYKNLDYETKDMKELGEFFRAIYVWVRGLNQREQGLDEDLE